MFNVVEKHQKVVKGIMIAITATFVVWGIGGYLGMGSDDGYIAKVGSNKIYSQDIDRAIDQNPNQSQDKMQILFGLINRQLLLNSIEDNHLTVTTKQLQDAIAAIPMFQTDGSFDVNKYQDFLKQRYTTSAKFEQDVSQQLAISSILDFYKNSYFSSETFKDKFAALLSRERNVSKYVIDPKQFYAKINISESDIKAYYQQNLASFTVPDQVKLNYIQVSSDSLLNTIKFTDADVTKYMQDHPNSANNEQIDVSHILFTVPANASNQQKEQIKAKALQVLAQVKANPAKFSELAKKYSEDPGSAQKGGDLGFFGKGVMVKPFEDVAFNMHKGQISGLVETQYGYHILKMNDIKNNDISSQRKLAEMQVRKQKAQQQLQSIVDQLNDITYNKPDSLDPAAQKLNLTVKTTDWVSKGSKEGIFANPKLQQAIFSNDVIQAHHNSEVIDLGDGSFIVVHATDYQPSRQKPIAEVKAQIVEGLKAQQAALMASQAGQQDILNLQQGKIKLNFSDNEDVTLLGQSKDIDPMTVRQIFATQTPSFPAYTGAISQNGAYVIYRINSQSTDNKLDAQNRRVIEQLSSQYSLMTLNAYVGSLRSRYSVSYKLDRIKDNGAAGSNSN